MPQPSGIRSCAPAARCVQRAFLRLVPSHARLPRDAVARRRRGGLRGRPDAPVARRDRGRVGGRAARAQAKGARQRVRRDAPRVVPQSEPRPEPEAAVRDRRVPRRGPGEDQEVLGALLAPTGEPAAGPGAPRRRGGRGRGPRGPVGRRRRRADGARGLRGALGPRPQAGGAAIPRPLRRLARLGPGVVPAARRAGADGAALRDRGVRGGGPLRRRPRVAAGARFSAGAPPRPRGRRPRRSAATWTASRTDRRDRASTSCGRRGLWKRA